MVRTDEGFVRGAWSARMKRWLCLASAFLIGAGPSPSDDDGTNLYGVVHGWPSYPAGFLIGDGSGVAATRDGEVLAFHRANRQWVDPLPLDPIAGSTLIAFDARTGRTLRQWAGGMFALPHGLSVDGQKNVWVTDIALQQVFKLSPEGQVLLTLGERGVAGNDERHFNRPTDVLAMPDGGFYVSDGYGNARVMKFDSNGRFQFEWGSPGSGPGQFKTPHSLALLSDGSIAVADRNNSRIQIFDQRGRYLSQWKLPGRLRPFAIATLPGKRVVVVGNAGRADDVPDTSGGIIAEETGRPLSTFGGYGRADGQFIAVHDVATDAAGAVYAINVADARVQKFVKQGTPRAASIRGGHRAGRRGLPA